MLLLGWGPYALLYLYAAVADVSLISPKLQMVQILPKPKESYTSSHLSLCITPSGFLLTHSLIFSFFFLSPSSFKYS